MSILSSPAANVFADKPQRICAIDTRWKLNPCHMHQFCVTAGHALLPEQPMTVDVTAMVANTIREKPLIDGMEWINGKDVVCFFLQKSNF